MNGRQRVFNVPTSVLIASAVLIVIQLVRTALPERMDFDLVIRLAFIPARYLPGGTSEIPGGEIAAVTSFVTYMLVHGGAAHLIMNLVWMLAFGSAVAKRIGDVRFFTFSVVCGVVGILTHLVLHWGDILPVVGASAAISGQMAGAFRFTFGADRSGGFERMQSDPRGFPLLSVAECLSDRRVLLLTAVWIGINFLAGFGVLAIGDVRGAVAWEAHIGGFLAGLLLFGLFDSSYAGRRAGR